MGLKLTSLIRPSHIEMTRLSQGCHNGLVATLWQSCCFLLLQPCDKVVCCMLTLAILPGVKNP